MKRGILRDLRLKIAPPGTTRERLYQFSRKKMNAVDTNRAGESIYERAKILNDQLYSDTREIPTHELIQMAKMLRTQCKNRGHSADLTDNWISHRYRIYLTIKWLREIYSDKDEKITALEMGGDSVVTDILRNAFLRWTWSNTSGDLRYPWSDIESESTDLIVSTEVLEHLSDQPTGIGNGFYKSGVKFALMESIRALKRGGFLFATTPNVASVIQLKNILEGSTPWFYDIHVREYTVSEIIHELKVAGFEIYRWRTVHCLTVDYNHDYTGLFQMLLEHKYDVSSRGDDIFVVARKPE